MDKFERVAKICMYIFIPGVVAALAAGLYTLIIKHHDISSKHAAISFGIGCLSGLLVGLNRKFA